MFRWEFRAIEGAYGRITYKMTIWQVRTEDYGIYTCNARTNIGVGEPASVELYGQ